MSDDPVADILGRLDRPVHPLADFGERLLASLVEGHLQSPRRTRALAAARLLVRPRVMVAVLSVAAIVAALVMFGRHDSLRVTTHPVAPVGPTPVAPNSGTTNGDGTGAPSTPGGSVTESGAAPTPSTTSGVAPPPPPSTPAHAHLERRVVYSRTNGNDHDLWIKNLDTGDESRLTGGTDDDVDPSWSPDGHRVVFDRAGHISVINDDGTGLEVIVDGAYPVWSPDGTEIAYVGLDPRPFGSCFKMNCTAIFVMSLVTGDTRYVTTGLVPSWSPDGSRLVLSDADAACSSTYVPSNGGYACDGTLYTIGADGRGRTSLGLVGWAPEFSPDGTRITYQTGQGADADIHVANGDGTNDRTVLGGPDDDTDPTWSGVGYGLLYHAGGAASAEQGIYACDENGGAHELIANAGEYPEVQSVLVPD